MDSSQSTTARIVAGEGRPDRLEFGGRWPDAAFFSFSRDYARTGVHHAALRWQTERWVDQARGEPEEGVLASFITAFAGGPDGAVFGLRSPRYIAQDPEEADLHAQEQALARARPVVERLDREQPPAWPALPAGPPADDLLGFPDGTLVVLRAGPRLEQWRPGASAWTSDGTLHDFGPFAQTGGALRRLAGLGRAGEDREELAPLAAELVEGPGLDQGLDHALVHALLVDAGLASHGGPTAAI